MAPKQQQQKPSLESEKHILATSGYNVCVVGGGMQNRIKSSVK